MVNDYSNSDGCTLTSSIVIGKQPEKSKEKDVMKAWMS
jgi:hypothetical protein